MRYVPVSLCGLLIVGLAVPTLAVSYSLTILDDLGLGNVNASDVNDARQVAGSAGRTGLMWDGAVTTDLTELPGYGSSSAYAINNSGMIAGNSSLAYPVQHAVLWSGGGVTDLGTIGGSLSDGKGINSAGDVVGYGWLAGDELTRGWVYDSGTGTTTVLGTLGSGASSWAADINDAGLVTGFSQYASGSYDVHPFVWDGATMTDLGVPGGYSQGNAITINNLGLVGGYLEDSDGMPRGFLWDAGTWTLIGDEGDVSIVTALNDKGDAVGRYHSATDGDYAFLYTGGTLINLNTYAPPGGVMDEATGINENGDICGNGDYEDESHFAWLLTRDEEAAVPEPGTFALMGLGLAGLLVARRRRQAA